jgi:phosphinothricin acetyltransferase
MLVIRPASLADLAAITAIYNEAILTTTGTFDTEPKNEHERQAWFEAHGPRHPVLVAEWAGQVVGWASLTKWSDRLAYAGTAEISLYIHSTHRDRGIGKELIAVLMQEGHKAGLHTLIARIASGNEASMRLLRAVGFEQIGVMREVGWKFGQLLDIHLMQLIYR